jgi:hypothetical protein
MHYFTNLFWQETCRFSCQNKFVKLVHLVGFIIKKFVTMHGHVNVKFRGAALSIYKLLAIFRSKGDKTSTTIKVFSCTRVIYF